MTTDPRSRRGDWKVNSELLVEEIEDTWPVRVSRKVLYHSIGQRNQIAVQSATATLTPPIDGFPHSFRALVPVDRQYITPFDRAEYMSLYQLWMVLDALDVPLRRPPQ